MNSPSAFDRPDPTRVANDPRLRPVTMAPEAHTGPRKISSTEQMVKIFNDVLATEAPPNKAIDYSNHRYRKEEGSFRISAFVGQVTPWQFEWSFRQTLDRGNEGSFLKTILNTQDNGVWAPTAWDIRGATHPYNDRKVPVRVRPPDGDMVNLDSMPAEAEMLPVPVDVLEYVIIWTDITNNTDIRFDHDGKRMGRVAPVTTDPALLQILAQQAEATQALSVAVLSRDAMEKGITPEVAAAPRPAMSDAQKSAMKKGREARAAKLAAKRAQTDAPKTDAK